MSGLACEAIPLTDALLRRDAFAVNTSLPTRPCLPPRPDCRVGARFTTTQTCEFCSVCRGLRGFLSQLAQGSCHQSISEYISTLRSAARINGLELVLKPWAGQMAGNADEPQHRCSVCDETQGRKLYCSRCKTRMYCSKECQRKDWPHHKQVRQWLSQCLTLGIAHIGAHLHCCNTATTGGA